jgi:hypothetical protein
MGNLNRFAITCMVGAGLCVCPGLGLQPTDGPHTQLFSYTDSQTAIGGKKWKFVLLEPGMWGW